MSSRRTKSWYQEHVSDEFVRRAQKEGYRSRAIYKLMEIDNKDRLLRPGMTVVDLGAAPGSWSQYAAAKIGKNGCLYALDRLPIEPIDGAQCLQGDFTDAEVINLLMERLAGRQVDLVISDLAPDISGIAAADQARTMELGERALEFCRRVLRPGGNFLVKSFHGSGYQEFYAHMKKNFKTLAIRKPKASRARSQEVYLLGREFLGV